MLEYLRIQRFKTLLDAEFSLSNLNLFTGVNGMGKSSLIQALLLLRQSKIANGLLLNGPYANLGVGRDVLAGQAEIESIDMLLEFAPVAGGDGALHFQFAYRFDSDLQPGGLATEPSLPLDSRSLFNVNFQYLSADRISPRSDYEVSDKILNKENSLGVRGEYTIQYIAERVGKNIAIPGLRHPNMDEDDFLGNLEAWMSELSPGIRIIATKETNKAVLKYTFRQGKERSNQFMPQNVGFGLTYVLPVVTALLRAKPGDLLMLENPESHLHPAGQSVVGRLCALAASNGVQLILESHSDHFLNSVRVAVKQDLIEANKVRLFYLERDDEDSTVVHSPKLGKDGRLDHWPTGFFDEWGKNLEQLL